MDAFPPHSADLASSPSDRKTMGIPGLGSESTTIPNPGASPSKLLRKPSSGPLSGSLGKGAWRNSLPSAFRRPPFSSSSPFSANDASKDDPFSVPQRASASSEDLNASRVAFGRIDVNSGKRAPFVAADDAHGLNTPPPSSSPGSRADRSHPSFPFPRKASAGFSLPHLSSSPPASRLELTSETASIEPDEEEDGSDAQPAPLFLQPSHPSRPSLLCGSYAHSLIVGRSKKSASKTVSGRLHALPSASASASSSLPARLPVREVKLPSSAKHVSRQHAVIEWVPLPGGKGEDAGEGSFVVRVLGQNGLIVEGKRHKVGSTIRLENGTRIDWFGFETSFVVPTGVRDEEEEEEEEEEEKKLNEREGAMLTPPPSSPLAAHFEPPRGGLTANDKSAHRSPSPSAGEEGREEPRTPAKPQSHKRPHSTLSPSSSAAGDTPRAVRVLDLDALHDEGMIRSHQPSSVAEAETGAADETDDEDWQNAPLRPLQLGVKVQAESKKKSENQSEGEAERRQRRSGGRGAATAGEKKKTSGGRRGSGHDYDNDNDGEAGADEADKPGLTDRRDYEYEGDYGPAQLDEDGYLVDLDDPAYEHLRPAPVASRPGTPSNSAEAEADDLTLSLCSEAREAVEKVARAYDMVGLCANALVFHRTATVGASLLTVSVLEATPGLMAGVAGALNPGSEKEKEERRGQERKEADINVEDGHRRPGGGNGKAAEVWEEAKRTAWRAKIEEVLQRTACFGVIQREGKDAAGLPLEPQFYYDPANDDDEERKTNLGSLVKPIRGAQKNHRTSYFFKRPRTPGKKRK